MYSSKLALSNTSRLIRPSTGIWGSPVASWVPRPTAHTTLLRRWINIQRRSNVVCPVAQGAVSVCPKLPLACSLWQSDAGPTFNQHQVWYWVLPHIHNKCGKPMNHVVFCKLRLFSKNPHNNRILCLNTFFSEIYIYILSFFRKIITYIRESRYVSWKY